MWKVSMGWVPEPSGSLAALLGAPLPPTYIFWGPTLRAREDLDPPLMSSCSLLERGVGAHQVLLGWVMWFVFLNATLPPLSKVLSIFLACWEIFFGPFWP